jgi:predicted ATPase
MKIHQAIILAYKKFGYQTIIVPAFSPAERVEFILSML